MRRRTCAEQVVWDCLVHEVRNGASCRMRFMGRQLVWINGTLSDAKDATVSAADHAHLYGDGIFEGIRIYHRRVFKLDEHLDRLYHGAKYFGYHMRISQPELRNVILDVCHQADLDRAYIRVNITRGTGLGLDPKNIDQTPNVMVMLSTLGLYPATAYETGLHVVTTSFRVMTGDTLDPRLKCIGRYAANIMAKQEANHAGAGEGLMLNAQGHIAECTGDNIFLVRGNTISTPHPSCGILRGITRDTVMELARGRGYEVREDFLTPFDIFAADEVFLTGTAAEVIPMVTLDGRPIGDGRPGPITRELMALYAEETHRGVAFDELVGSHT